MVNEHDSGLEECISDASGHENGFAHRIVKYQTEVLIPALHNLGGNCMLPQNIRCYKESSYKS
jgi:hypothetical protein